MTATGIEQAHRIGHRLSREIKKGQFILYSSDLLRARHTAEIIAGYTGGKLILTDALREIYLGEAVGKSKEWARRNAICPVWPGTIDYAETADEIPFNGAESRGDVWAHLLNFYKQVIENSDNHMILISHDGTLSLFYAMWLGLKPEITDHYCLSGHTGDVSFLHEDADKHHLILRLIGLSYIPNVYS